MARPPPATPADPKDPYSRLDAPVVAIDGSQREQAELHVKLGRGFLRAGDTGRAAEAFTKAREFDPGSADAIAGLGEVAFEQGRYGEAVVHLKRAVRLAPNRARYHVLMGHAQYKSGDPRGAAAEYKRALNLDPDNVEARESLKVALDSAER